MLTQLGTLVAKLIYSAILLGIALACLLEISRLWFDRTLYIEAFKFSKDGQDVPASGLAFANMLQQQQGTLLRLFNHKQRDEHEIFYRPLNIEGLDIGHLETAQFSDVKVEAGGLNLTELLGTIRRWVSTPNRIAGSVSQAGPEYYVYAVWSGAPSSKAGKAEDRSYALRPRVLLSDVSFDLSCRIAYTQLAANNNVIVHLTEDDFCSFAGALATFDQFLAVRDSTEQVKTLEPRLKECRTSLDALVSRGSGFPYIWKLAAYISIEHSALSSDPAEKTAELDKAQRHLQNYLDMLGKENQTDESAKARLEFLRARKDSRQVAASGPQISAPGRSISIIGSQSAASACCVVQDAAGVRYLLTTDYAVQGAEAGTSVVSPADVDAGQTGRAKGSVERIDKAGHFALIRLEHGELWNNVTPDGKPIEGIADTFQIGEPVIYLGRTSGQGMTRILQFDTDFRLGSDWLEGAIVAEHYSKPGDGGGPVISPSNRLIGMTYASSPEQAYILPVRKLLVQNRLTLVQ